MKNRLPTLVSSAANVPTNFSECAEYGTNSAVEEYFFMRDCNPL